MRQVGLKQSFSPLEHPFLNLPTQVFAWGGDASSFPRSSQGALKAAASLHPKLGFFLDVCLTQDGVWIVCEGENLEEYSNLRGWVQNTDWEKIRQATLFPKNVPPAKRETKSDPAFGPIRLEDALSLIGDRPFVLNVHARDPNDMSSLITFLGQRAADSVFALASPSINNLKKLREAAPRWPFAMPEALLAKLFMAESFYIETFIAIQNDFIIFPLSGNPELHPRLLDEIRRRKMRLFLQVNSQQSKTLPSQEELRKFNGIMTDRPSEVLFLLPSE